MTTAATIARLRAKVKEARRSALPIVVLTVPVPPDCTCHEKQTGLCGPCKREQDAAVGASGHSEETVRMILCIRKFRDPGEGRGA